MIHKHMQAPPHTCTYVSILILSMEREEAFQFLRLGAIRGKRTLESMKYCLEARGQVSVGIKIIISEFYGIMLVYTS